MARVDYLLSLLAMIGLKHPQLDWNADHRGSASYLPTTGQQSAVESQQHRSQVPTYLLLNGGLARCTYTG